MDTRKTVIFISHIHEESAFAIILQEAIKQEFGKLTPVFVSSDGKSIGAGGNIQKGIDEGLIDCDVAIYLMSPVSLNRRWINFELGAVWIRNLIGIRQKSETIPIAIPLCHSGFKPTDLASPMNNLLAKIASKPEDLKSVFEALQIALNDRDPLRTDFDLLAKKIADFENRYTQDLKERKSDVGSIYVEQINHVGLPVKNLKESLIFYNEILQLKKIDRPHESFDFKGEWLGLPNGQSIHLLEDNGKVKFNYRERTLDIALDKPPDVHFALRVSLGILPS